MAMGVYDGSARQFGDDLAPSGPAPAAAPRVVPEDFVSQSAGAELKQFRFAAAAFGFFTLIGLIFFASGETGGLVFALLTVPFLLGLAYEVRKLLHHQDERKRIYQHGLIAAATVHSCRSVGHTIRHSNTRATIEHHVHEVDWTFVVGGHRFEGSTKAASAYAARLHPGDPLWVLVDPNDFGQSMEWPIGFALTENSATAPQDGVDPAPSIGLQDAASTRRITPTAPPPVIEEVVRDPNGAPVRVMSLIVGLGHIGLPLVFIWGILQVVAESDSTQRLVLLAFLIIPVFFVINGVKLIAQALKGGHTES